MLKSRGFRLVLGAAAGICCYLPHMLDYNGAVYSDSKLQAVLSVEGLSSNEAILLLSSYSSCVVVGLHMLVDAGLNLNEMNILGEFYERICFVATALQMGFMVLAQSGASASFGRCRYSPV